MGLCLIHSLAVNLSIALEVKVEDLDRVHGSYSLSVTQRTRDIHHLFVIWRKSIDKRQEDFSSGRRGLVFDWTVAKLQEIAILIHVWQGAYDRYSLSQVNEIGQLVVLLFTVWKWPLKLSSTYHVDGQYGNSCYLVSSNLPHDAIAAKR